jgi:hypothetical protein
MPAGNAGAACDMLLLFLPMHAFCTSGRLAPVWLLCLHLTEIMHAPSYVCSLYVTVISTIRGYGDYLWVDVVEKVESMGNQVNEFQNQSKKLPKVWNGVGCCHYTCSLAASCWSCKLCLHAALSRTESLLCSLRGRLLPLPLFRHYEIGPPTKTAGKPSTTSWSYCPSSRRSPTSLSGIGGALLQTLCHMFLACQSWTGKGRSTVPKVDFLSFLARCCSAAGFRGSKEKPALLKGSLAASAPVYLVLQALEGAHADYRQGA